MLLYSTLIMIILRANRFKTGFGFYSGHWFSDDFGLCRLCAPIPIDIVYTWVNGTDPELLEELSKVKLEFEAELNRTRLVLHNGCWL